VNPSCIRIFPGPWAFVAGGKLIQATRKTKIDGGKKFALFGVTDDWKETTNLVGEHAEAHAQLTVLLKKQKEDRHTVMRRAG
jgi:hypothetical protein